MIKKKEKEDEEENCLVDTPSELIKVIKTVLKKIYVLDDKEKPISIYHKAFIDKYYFFNFYLNKK
jgi:hypothetical protein